MKRIAALALWTLLLFAQEDLPGQRAVTAVRHWSLGDVTRVAVEVSADFTYRTERLHNPERVYFDIPNSRPRVGQHLLYTVAMDDDPRVKRLRVAETMPGVTRVVLDLAGVLNVTTSQLANPDRLIIEVRIGPAPAGTSSPQSPPGATSPTGTLPTGTSPTGTLPTGTSPAGTSPAGTSPAGTSPAGPSTGEPTAPLPDAPRPGPIAPARNAVKAVAADDLASAEMVTAEPSKSQLGVATPAKTDEAVANPPAVESPKPAVETAKTDSLPHEPMAAPPSVPPAPSALRAVPGETPRAARRTAGGDSSLVRELGLKISRVVIDPGHGGHDHGTEGPHGLVEKELVLDVAKRVGKMIEEKMGADVIYTRSDDTFVSLEGRTALANEKKADLFLSIHANSSPIVKIAGVETYYLNFPDTRDAIDLAARENAAAQSSLFELRDLIQKIALHDKAEESREFANRIQSSLFAFSARNFPGTRNRGVKKAPFVVLIGAQMPSILAEIGFVSNQREEGLLKKPDYRQKLAEALFQGVKRYADSLSHFQVAQTQNQP